MAVRDGHDEDEDDELLGTIPAFLQSVEEIGWEELLDDESCCRKKT